MVDTIIIGGGPSGMTAALYLLRAGKSVQILEKESFGGQIAKSPRLENYPTVKSISGLEWSDALFNQVTELGADFDLAEVSGVEKLGEGHFLIHTNYGDKEAKSVVISTGCEHRQLGLDREEELVGHGVSYCATCDGAFFSDKDVLVIGDANTALQYAILLSSMCKSVTIVTLFKRFFADDILVKRIKENPKIKVFMGYSAKKFLGEGELNGVTFEDTESKEEKTFPCDGCFICIGQVPNNEPFANLVELEKGFIKTDERMATKTAGVFASGDCRVKGVRQVITATSDGAIAAVSASNYLNSLEE